MSIYSIKQLELVSGIKAHTIRMWEKRYGLFSPQRTDTNIRRYTDFDVQLILNISLLTRNGYRISKVANRSLDEVSNLVLQLTAQKSTPGKSDIEPLIQSMLSFNQIDFKAFLHKNIEEYGLEKTFEVLIIPLLHRIGILWQTGMINSVHEHFVSNITKYLIIHSTEMIKEPKPDSPVFIYFLPEGEYHEIGLLFYAYLGKKMGFRTIYLGQSTPHEDIVKTLKKLNPAVLFTSISTFISNENHLDFLKNLQKDLPNAHLFLTGHKAAQDKKSLPKNITVVSTYESFASKLASLKIRSVS
jgi:DNA-binding transcriptional MerR regulator